MAQERTKRTRRWVIQVRMGSYFNPEKQSLSRGWSYSTTELAYWSSLEFRRTTRLKRKQLGSTLVSRPSDASEGGSGLRRRCRSVSLHSNRKTGRGGFAPAPPVSWRASAAACAADSQRGYGISLAVCKD